MSEEHEQEHLRRTTCGSCAFCPFFLTAALLLNAVCAQSNSQLGGAESCPSENDATCVKPSYTPNKNEKCKLYLAESSIPHSGLGMYTGVNISTDEAIGSPEIIIHLTDMLSSNLFDDYYWSSQNKILGKSVSELKPGFGMAANSHLGLVNVGHHHTNPKVDAAGLHRSSDPGAGAISWHHNLIYNALVNITAGSELFENYGAGYFISRTEKMGVLPLEHNYKQADNIAKKIHSFLEGQDERITESTEMNSTGYAADLLGLLRACADDPRTEVAIPTSKKELDQVAKVGSAMHSLSTPSRSLAWLEEHGTCMDNLREGQSTVSGAGRGAFATRFIAKGEVIAPAPLVHIPRDDLKIYARIRDKNSTAIIVSNTTVVGHQLILNYCFGHRNSSLVFFPYSSSVHFVNHKSDRPNAEIQWSKLKSHKSEWLKESAEDVLKKQTAGLIIDFVATRDIQPGEEVFIDYGGDWEQAWTEHKKEWRPVPGADQYVPAHDVNAMDVPVRTFLEQKDDPYPVNCEVTCYYRFRPHHMDDGMQRDFKTEDVDLLDLQAIVDSSFRWNKTFDLYDRDTGFYPCKILARTVTPGGGKQADEILYLALISNPFDNVTRFVSHIPRVGINIVDKRYTTDVNLPNAFRHHISIPDDMFPSPWLEGEIH